MFDKNMFRYQLPTNHIDFPIKLVEFSLILVALEALDQDFFDENHGESQSMNFENGQWMTANRETQ
jgi:hypothetical protein